MNIARIDFATNIVDNVEVADEDWTRAANARRDAGDVYFVPYDEANPAHIGLTYDPVTGVFEQPPAPVPPVRDDPDPYTQTEETANG